MKVVVALTAYSCPDGGFSAVSKDQVVVSIVQYEKKIVLGVAHLCAVVQAGKVVLSAVLIDWLDE